MTYVKIYIAIYKIHHVPGSGQAAAARPSEARAPVRRICHGSPHKPTQSLAPKTTKARSQQLPVTDRDFISQNKRYLRANIIESIFYDIG